MFPEIARRLLATIPVMGVVAIAVFALLHATPGDPAVIIAGDYATGEDIARIRAKLGLDQPFLTQVGLWVGRMSRTFSALKTEIEREIGMDEIKRQLHNEAVMDELKRLERDVRGPTSNGSSHAEVKEPEPPSVASTPAEVSAAASNDPQSRA